MISDESIAKVFIRPVNHCNFVCKHCFVEKGIFNKEKITLDDSKYFLKLLAEQFSFVYVRFHGGEPTLIGKGFYKEVFKYQDFLSKKYNVCFFNTIQTNGYLLDDEYIKILIDGNCTIGISYDGNHNDVLRPYSDKILETIYQLKKYKATFSAICVETQQTINKVIDTYQWFKKENIHFKFHPVLPRGFAKTNNLLILDIENYVNKITDLYKYWLKDESCNIHVSTFEEFVQIKPSKVFKKIWFERNKFALNSDGNLYVYGYPNEKNYSLGSVKQSSKLRDVFLLPNYIKLQNDIKSIILKHCQNCSVKQICGGTCICSSFLFDSSIENITYSCNLARRTFEEIIKINEQLKFDYSSKGLYQYNKYVRKLYQGE